MHERGTRPNGGGTMNITERKNWIAGSYFGLEVKVLYKLDQCSLILFQDREFIVETRDLVFGKVLPRFGISLRKAA